MNNSFVLSPSSQLDDVGGAEQLEGKTLQLEAPEWEIIQGMK